MAGMSVAFAAAVDVQSLPHGGIQPQIAMEAGGTVHLVYFQGEPRNGDIHYTRRQAGEDDFSAPVRVNDREESAVAVGTIRGAQLAVGRAGRVHVVWNGSASSHDGDHASTPLFYARLNDAGTKFEPQRHIITSTRNLDGGASVMADGAGRVQVVWHASPPGNELGEAGRAVYLAESRDEGKMFARERVISPAGTGACGCCGLKAYADRDGNTYVLFRAARQGKQRDEILLAARSGSLEFEEVHAHPWLLNTCPMSSAFLGPGTQGVLAAWETEGQVYLARVGSEPFQLSELWSPPGWGRRKHAVAARNGAGETLLVWIEGSGWNQGGTLAWQVFDPEDRPSGDQGRGGQLPVWSFAACYARPDGSFVILR